MRGFSEICDNTGSVESKQPVKYKRSLAGNVTKATKQNRQTEKQTYPSLSRHHSNYKVPEELQFHS